MEGCEGAIEELVRERVKDVTWEMFRYLEIGVASGDTLRSVTEIVREAVAASAMPFKKWVTIGIDLPPGEAWALDLAHVRGLMPDLVVKAETPVTLSYGRPHLVLKNAREVLDEWPFRWSLDLALIDGCHGKRCVMADFEQVARFVIPGGYVIFHDAGAADQGHDFQPHCKEGINVRAALRELGLLEGGLGREGWRFVREIAGDKTRGGNSCVVVQREALKEGSAGEFIEH